LARRLLLSDATVPRRQKAKARVAVSAEVDSAVESAPTRRGFRLQTLTHHVDLVAKTTSSGNDAPVE
jgi:hypothetical protein